MKKLIIVIVVVLVMCLLVPVSCAKEAPAPAPAPRPAPAPITAPVPMPSPVFTNSESASRIAELEAKIRQFDSDNQRLLAENRQFDSDNQRLVTENRQLSSDLVKVTNQLEGIQSLVTSSSYAQTINSLSDVQSKTNDLVSFASGLPDLPPLPPGLTVSQINDAIDKAVFLRGILKKLPPPPPLIAPPVWYELDNMKGEFIRMTIWMEDLEDLPDFLNKATNLKDLRSRIQSYIQTVSKTASDTSGILEEVRNAARSQ